MQEAKLETKHKTSNQIPQDDKKLRDGYKKFVSHVEMELLDYQHNNPIIIEQCINTLITLFKNIVENPEVEKYRKVKERNDILSKSVMNVRGGEQALVFSGWTRTVRRRNNLYVLKHHALHT
mmetsp:Transcript_11096/g.20094  ORF Transcript_11096/g.20094 Transcript_11096/m.20094 type:complete len:122 (-) Transcript_11096:21-386(-)